MLIQKIEFKIAKDIERLEVHWKKWDTLLQFSDISQTLSEALCPSNSWGCSLFLGVMT